RQPLGTVGGTNLHVPETCPPGNDEEETQDEEQPSPNLLSGRYAGGQASRRHGGKSAGRGKPKSGGSSKGKGRTNRTNNNGSKPSGGDGGAEDGFGTGGGGSGSGSGGGGGGSGRRGDDRDGEGDENDRGAGGRGSGSSGRTGGAGAAGGSGGGRDSEGGHGAGGGGSGSSGNGGGGGGSGRRDDDSGSEGDENDRGAGGAGGGSSSRTGGWGTGGAGRSGGRRRSEGGHGAGGDGSWGADGGRHTGEVDGARRRKRKSWEGPTTSRRDDKVLRSAQIHSDHTVASIAEAAVWVVGRGGAAALTGTLLSMLGPNDGLSYVLKNVSGGGAAAASKDNRKPRDEARIDACWMMLPFSDAMIGSNQTRYNSDGAQKGEIANNIFWRAASLVIYPKVAGTIIRISEYGQGGMRDALTSVRSAWHKQIRAAVVKAVKALVAYSFTSSAEALGVRLCDVEDARDLVYNVTQILEALRTTDEIYYTMVDEIYAPILAVHSKYARVKPAALEDVMGSKDLAEDLQSKCFKGLLVAALQDIKSLSLPHVPKEDARTEVHRRAHEWSKLQSGGGGSKLFTAELRDHRS
ncbi:unnamed protein product, partial [Ectocarpus fasciculatus]